MSPVQGASGRCATWPKDVLRISFGVIWLIDAVLKWLPGFRTQTSPATAPDSAAPGKLPHTV